MATAEQIKKLEEKYDPELNFRVITSPATWIVGTMLVMLAIFHYYTAGFGLFREATHRGIHISFVLSLVFLIYGVKRGQRVYKKFTLGGIPYYDWFFACLSVFAAYYMPYEFDQLAFRIGNPLPMDVFAGSCMILVVLEATRRAMGPALSIISITFILYGIYGQYAPGVLAHPGSSWNGLVNHLYLTSQGIYGIPVGVVATYVFHFVLFGTLANQIGAGKLFLDLAMFVAGRFRGGPAKVSIFSSAMFGMISGSSIANTVTTGSLTIPAMKKAGYPAHFAAAVEATASTGGQITPPIMGAAAFIMVEFLNIPYREIMLAALVPALMHYLGIFIMVHLEAKKLGLQPSIGNAPKIKKILKDEWFVLIPIILLITVLLIGYTPFMAAFWGITACVVVGFLNPGNRLTVKTLIKALQLGSELALAVGAAAAAVGIVVGVVTLTGMGFRTAFMVTSLASQFGVTILQFIPFFDITIQQLTLFLTLIFTAFSCILLGAGIPTTATYIILVTIAAPALATLGIEPLVAHFFVFYYGVLADITPPVALAAYAGAGIAKANPFKTGNTAFRLASAKALVPFVFVYSPSMLIITKEFTWQSFIFTTTTCALGIVVLGTAMVGYGLRPMPIWIRLLAFFAALGLISPSLTNFYISCILIIPVVLHQYRILNRAEN